MLNIKAGRCGKNIISRFSTFLFRKIAHSTSHQLLPVRKKIRPYTYNETFKLCSLLFKTRKKESALYSGPNQISTLNQVICTAMNHQ